MSALADYKVFDPAHLADPYPAYAALHAAAPVYFDAATATWVVTGYDEVRRVVMAPELFSSAVRAQQRAVNPTMRAVDAVYARDGWERLDTLSVSDPPTHTRYRNMVSRWFTPARMKASQAHVAAVVDELLDAAVPAGGCEFMTGFAVPMPIRVFAVQLGVPRAEMALFQRFGDAGIEAISMLASPTRELELAAVGVEEQRYFAARIEHYRAHPELGLLISDLANERDESGEMFGMAELLSMISILVLGGNETTTNALSTALWLMMATPGLEDRLRSDSKLTERFIEEALRYLAPVQGVFRIATRDVELGGVAVPAGARLLIKFGAANRDARAFDRPDAFDPLRADVRRHIAFGAGIKHCVGAPLARLELQVAFARLLARVRDVRPAEAGFRPSYVPNIITYGMATLPVIWSAR